MMSEWFYDRIVREKDTRASRPGGCGYCPSALGEEHADDCVVILGKRLDAAPPGVWQPIDTYNDGDYVLFWFPEGERGSGAKVSAMGFRHGDRWAFWSHGGPNAGFDYDPGADNEAPTLWARLPDDPA